MSAVNSRNAELDDIATSVLPVCDFRYRRTTASSSMMNANRARMQLSERVAERATELVESW